MWRASYTRRVEIGAAILCGGRGRRMGEVMKGLLDVGGRPIAARQAEALRAAGAGEVLLVGGDRARYAALGLPHVDDETPGAGPVAGLVAALRSSRARRAVLVVGCDLPLVEPALLAALVALVDDAVDAAVPRVDGRAQPLCAAYAPRVADRAAAQLASGNARLVAFVESLAVRFVDEPELRAHDPELRSLVNVNTPEDLARARALLQRL